MGGFLDGKIIGYDSLVVLIYQPGLKFVQVIRPFLGPRIPSSEEGFPFLFNGSSMKFNRISWELMGINGSKILNGIFTGKKRQS